MSISLGRESLLVTNCSRNLVYKSFSSRAVLIQNVLERTHRHSQRIRELTYFRWAAKTKVEWMSWFLLLFFRFVKTLFGSWLFNGRSCFNTRRRLFDYLTAAPEAWKSHQYEVNSQDMQYNLCAMLYNVHHQHKELKVP